MRFIMFAAFLPLSSGCTSGGKKQHIRDQRSENRPENTYSIADEEDGYRCTPL